MPKVVINSSKGLYQEGGTGVVVQSKGITGVLSQDQALTGLGPANYDGSFTLRAGATIEEIGFTFKTECKTSGGGADKLTFEVDTASGFAGTDIIAPVEILIGNKTGVAGSGQNTSAGNKAEASSTALVFPNAIPAYSATNRTIYYRWAVASSGLVSKGTVCTYVKYTIL